MTARPQPPPPPPKNDSDKQQLSCVAGLTWHVFAQVELQHPYPIDLDRMRRHRLRPQSAVCYTVLKKITQAVLAQRHDVTRLLARTDS